MSNNIIETINHIENLRNDLFQVTKSNADRRLPSTDSVVTLLKWVERHMATRLVSK